MKTEQIAYEPHPVSAERKAELRAKGFRIIDAQFKPADVAEPAVATEPAATPTQRKSKHQKSEA